MNNLKHNKNPHCILCGISLTDKNQTIEHIIPKSIFHSNKVVIREICKKCNNKLGKEIEQPAVQYLKEIIGGLVVQGHPLRLGRRNKKRRYIREGKAMGILPFKKGTEYIPCLMDIDLVEKTRTLNFQPDWVKKDSKDFVENFPDEHAIIFPARDNDGLEELQLLSFKIIFELCYYLWGIMFLKSKSAEDLKKILLDGQLDFSKTEILKPEIPLLEWSDDHNSKETSNEEMEINEDQEEVLPSPFDNPPHITFAIIKPEEVHWIAVLNLYGSVEFTTRLFDQDKEMNDILEETEGIILIIEQTGKKEVKKYQYHEYEEKKFPKIKQI